MSIVDYANKQAHVELAERMKIRDAGKFPILSFAVSQTVIYYLHTFRVQVLHLRWEIVLRMSLLRAAKALRRMTSLRTRCTCWRRISRLTQCTIWTTNCPSPCCEFLNLFWERRPNHYVSTDAALGKWQGEHSTEDLATYFSLLTLSLSSFGRSHEDDPSVYSFDRRIDEVCS